jgi:hypothetical protein
MSRELWATYSVMDHLEPRALAADIMLFDRLVFPVPENARFPENSNPIEVGPVEWKPNPDEWARWEHEGWDPEAQSKLLGLLEKVSRKVSWDTSHRDQWRTEAAELASQHIPDYAFHATRSVITRDLPAYVEGVAAVGPAYRTVEQMERELGIKDAQGQKRLPQSCLAAVLGWEFFTPADARLSDEQLLKETVDFVTSDDEFKRSRRAFIDWQQGFLTRQGLTDRESIRVAVKDIRELLEAENAAARKWDVAGVARYAYRIVPIPIEAALPFLSPVGAAVTSAVLSVGKIAVEKFLNAEEKRDQPASTAFVHLVNRHFGWEV